MRVIQSTVKKMLHHQKIMEMSSYAKGLYLDFSLKKDTRIFKDTLENPQFLFFEEKKSLIVLKV